MLHYIFHKKLVFLNESFDQKLLDKTSGRKDFLKTLLRNVTNL